MMKHEFEKAYGRKVTAKRWQEIEAAYMASGCLDRIDFVAEGITEDRAGYYQNYLRYDNGDCQNLIFQFDAYDEDGHGFGYCYILDNTISGCAAGKVVS